MVRHYRKKTSRKSPDRPLRIREERRAQIDVERIAEVLIRLALSDDAASSPEIASTNSAQPGQKEANITQP